MPKRRRLAHSNLHHAFPDWDRDKRSRIARRSSVSLVELGAFSLVSPFLSKKWLTTHIRVPSTSRVTIDEAFTNGKPTVIFIPHVAMIEALAVFPILHPLIHVGGLYRPLNQKALNQYVVYSRAKHGLELLSRKEGFSRCLTLLRNRAAVFILFDQAAGNPGATTLFLNRVCSATDLPGILAEKFQANLLMVYPRRTRGWNVEIEATLLEAEPNTRDITRVSNAWVEQMVQRSEAECADWQWLHNRWKIHHLPTDRLRFIQKKSFLPDTLPPSYRIWIDCPESIENPAHLEDFCQAILKSRPDAEITLMGSPRLLENPAILSPHHLLKMSPSQDAGYFKAYRESFPDLYLNLHDTPDFDQRGIWLDIPERFGWSHEKGDRPHLSHTFAIPDPAAWEALPELERWLTFARHFGLRNE